MMRRTYQRFLLWSFERLYHEFAWSYDLVAAAVSGGAWQHWITATVPWLYGDQVLDLGCGTGYLQVALAQAGIPHVGYDLSPQMLRQARRRLHSHAFPLRLARGRGECLPFPNASFSDVVATFPAPYIVNPMTVAEIRRVLRHDGQLLIIDGGHVQDANRYETALQQAYRVTPPKETGNLYIDALQQAGFHVTVEQLTVGRTGVGLVRAAK